MNLIWVLAYLLLRYHDVWCCYPLGAALACLAVIFAFLISEIDITIFKKKPQKRVSRTKRVRLLSAARRATSITTADNNNSNRPLTDDTKKGLIIPKWLFATSSFDPNKEFFIIPYSFFKQTTLLPLPPKPEEEGRSILPSWLFNTTFNGLHNHTVSPIEQRKGRIIPSWFFNTTTTNTIDLWVPSARLLFEKHEKQLIIHSPIPFPSFGVKTPLSLPLPPKVLEDDDDDITQSGNLSSSNNSHITTNCQVDDNHCAAPLRCLINVPTTFCITTVACTAEQQESNQDGAAASPTNVFRRAKTFLQHVVTKKKAVVAAAARREAVLVDAVEEEEEKKACRFSRLRAKLAARKAAKAAKANLNTAAAVSSSSSSSPTVAVGQQEEREAESEGGRRSSFFSRIKTTLKRGRRNKEGEEE